MRKILRIIVLFVLLFGVERAMAQADNNIMLYNNQATLFGDQGPAFDPVSIIIPGTAMKSGIGSFIDNPASMALFDKSIGEFGLSFGNVSEDASYLGNSRTMENDQFNFSNLGFLYSLPTKQGSLVFGGAYTRHTTFNRALAFRARNENSTITDLFKTYGSIYQQIAYETYAIDYLDFPEECGYDGNQFIGEGCESIFRTGFYDNNDDYIFGEYLGVQQQGEIMQSGGGGEYSLFFATEFQKNLMVGASIGLISGRFEYNRIFQEIDNLDYYNSNIINVDGGTDIGNILLNEKLTSRYNGFRARAGFLYKVTENVNVGVSYTLPTTIFIDEDLDASIRTTFDSGTEISESTNNQFSYNVIYPGMAALGVAIQDFLGLSVSVSADYVDYSSTEIEFEESDNFDRELEENESIRDIFQSVWSYRGGIAYDLTPDFTIRGGYRFQPSRFAEGNDDRTTYSLGGGFSIGNGIRFEAAAQYTTWDEVSAVYDYGIYNYDDLPEELPEVSTASETVNRMVDRWQFFCTVKVEI